MNASELTMSRLTLSRLRQAATQMHQQSSCSTVLKVVVCSCFVVIFPKIVIMI